MRRTRTECYAVTITTRNGRSSAFKTCSANHDFRLSLPPHERLGEHGHYRGEAFPINTFMNTTHTPGPWKWNGTDTCIWPTHGERRAEIANVFTAKNPGSDLSVASDCFSKEEEANARLIAASPELLAALKEIDLRLTQTRLASNIGKKKTDKERANFLQSQIEAINKDIRDAIAKIEEPEPQGQDQESYSDTQDRKSYSV